MERRGKSLKKKSIAIEKFVFRGGEIFKSNWYFFKSILQHSLPEHNIISNMAKKDGQQYFYALVYLIEKFIIHW